MGDFVKAVKKGCVSHMGRKVWQLGDLKLLEKEDGILLPVMSV